MDGVAGWPASAEPDKVYDSFDPMNGLNGALTAATGSARFQRREGPREWIFTTLGSSDFRFGLPHMAMSRASSVCSISSMVWTPAEP